MNRNYHALVIRRYKNLKLLFVVFLHGKKENGTLYSRLCCINSFSSCLGKAGG